MVKKVIFPESVMGEDKAPFYRLMALVSPEERSDINLQRFLMFRMKIDGEEATRAYLMRKIEQAKDGDFAGSLYEYLMDHQVTSASDLSDETPPDEPG